MLVYLVSFTIITAITMLAERILKKNNNKFAFGFLSLIVIFLVAGFAGVRDKTVGTDVLVYAEPIINSIKLYGIDFTIKFGNVEKLYLVLAYFIVKINGNLNTLLFFSQLLTFLMLYIYAYINRKESSITMTVLVYLLMIYGLTFNLMRQSIAMFIVLYSLKYVKQRQMIKYIIGIIVAMNFHITAVFTLILYWIYPIFKKKEKLLYQVVILSIVVLIVLSIKQFLQIMLNVGILPDKFAAYLGKFLLEETDLQIKASIMKLILLILPCIYIFYKKKKNTLTEYDQFIFFVILIDFVLFQAGAIISYAERISYYFSTIGYLYIIPRLNNIVKQNSLNKFFGFLCVIILLIAYWYVTFVVLGVSSIIPYKSIILGI